MYMYVSCSGASTQHGIPYIVKFFNKNFRHFFMVNSCDEFFVCFLNRFDHDKFVDEFLSMIFWRYFLDAFCFFHSKTIMNTFNATLIFVNIVKLLSKLNNIFRERRKIIIMGHLFRYGLSEFAILLVSLLNG